MSQAKRRLAARTPRPKPALLALIETAGAEVFIGPDGKLWTRGMPLELAAMIPAEVRTLLEYLRHAKGRRHN